MRFQLKTKILKRTSHAQDHWGYILNDNYQDLCATRVKNVQEMLATTHQKKSKFTAKPAQLSN